MGLLIYLQKMRLWVSLLLLFSIVSCGRKGYPPGKPETQGPTLHIINIKNGDTLRDKVSVEVEARDPSGVSWVSLLVDGKEERRDSSEPFLFELDTKNFKDTLHILQAKGSDKWDNIGFSEKIEVLFLNREGERDENKSN